MLDGYEEIWEMARKLGYSAQPLWWDLYGCPRWQPPKKELEIFVKKIRCQACGQEMTVCLVDDVYRAYKGGIFMSGMIPKHWHYKDPPAHPNKSADWIKEWWKDGWESICMGATMTSIPEWEFEEWEFKDGSCPFYKKEFAAETEKDDS